jgi:hypothetical protein
MINFERAFQMTSSDQVIINSRGPFLCIDDKLYNKLLMNISYWRQEIGVHVWQRTEALQKTQIKLQQDNIFRNNVRVLEDSKGV